MPVTPTRVDRLSEFAPLWQALDRFIEGTFDPRNGWTNWTSRPQLPVEVVETPDEFVVRAAMPGMKPEQLAVEYDGGVLTIRAKNEVAELKDGWRVHLSEFAYGEAFRQFRLPRTIDVDQATSTFEHGILTLVLPKAADAKAKHIRIETPGLAAQIDAGTSG
jgi:HSP20 family protein